MRQRWPPFLVLFLLYSWSVASPADCVPRPAPPLDQVHGLPLERTRSAQPERVTDYNRNRPQPQSPLDKPVTALPDNGASDQSSTDSSYYLESPLGRDIVVDNYNRVSLPEEEDEEEENEDNKYAEDYPTASFSPSSDNYHRNGDSPLHGSRQRQLLQEIDGGFEEGEREDLFDLQAEIEEFKQRLLAELGLERPPDTSKANVSESEMRRMLELYHRSVEESRQQEEEEEERERRNHWSGPGSFESVYRIYSFRNTGQELTSRRQNPREDRFVFFQVADSFPEQDHRNRSLSSAKLHLFRPCGDMRPSSNSARKDSPHRRRGADSPVRLAIYQLTEPWVSYNASQWGDEPALTGRILVEEKLLSGVSVERGAAGRSGSSRPDDWLVVDVSKPAAVWLETPLLNYGLLVKCFGGERSLNIPSNYSRLDDQNKQWAAEASVANSQQWRESESVLDILVRESNFPVDGSRSKRSISGYGREQRDTRGSQKSPLWNPNVLGDGGQMLECSATKKTKLCCRYSLNVSFQDIGWDWINEPKQFEANFCRGRCPSKAKNYASTHALIQSIINSKQGKRSVNVPRPCCAPKKLKSLNILHLDQSDPPKLVMTRKKGMIVKECACS